MLHYNKTFEPTKSQIRRPCGFGAMDVYGTYAWRCFALLRLKHFCVHSGCRMEVISGPFLGGGPTVAFSAME